MASDDSAPDPPDNADADDQGNQAQADDQQQQPQQANPFGQPGAGVKTPEQLLQELQQRQQQMQQQARAQTRLASHLLQACRDSRSKRHLDVDSVCSPEFTRAVMDLPSR